MKQIDIIKEILERLDFPTKGLEDFDVFKKKLSATKMRSLSIVTHKGRVIGYYMIGTTWGINHLQYTGEPLPSNEKIKLCALGTELSARMKGGE